MAKTTIDKSKIAKALVDRIVNKEHLASKRTVYYALEDERFSEFKDQRTKGRKGKTKNNNFDATIASNSTYVQTQRQTHSSSRIEEQPEQPQQHHHLNNIQYTHSNESQKNNYHNGF